jgi:processive 1,2-diacylglycerol beta-glucosyltransferase
LDVRSIRRLPERGRAFPAWFDGTDLGETDVLNLTADYGAGHRRASAAIQDALEELDPGIRVLTLNYIWFVHPLLDRITQSLYVNTVKVAPELYRGFYYVTKAIDPDSIWQSALNNLGHRRLLRLLQRVRPRIVLCTFPTPAGVVGELKRRGLVDVAQVTVITDNAVHTQWVSNWTDLYLVGSDYVKQGLEQRGIREDRILVTGIPIDRRFRGPWEREALASKYHLRPDLPVVLLLGSAYGMSPDAWETAQWLGRVNVPCQVLVVAGRDEKLRKKCEEATASSKNPVKVFGFVDTMHELMALSEMAITKAGGLTVSEALATGLPLVIHKPIPGQEEENAKFLLRHGAAVTSKDAGKTRQLALSLLRDPERRNKMREKALAIGHPYAAETAAKEMWTRYLSPEAAVRQAEREAVVT